MPAVAGDGYHGLFDDRAIRGTWLPDAEQIAALEAALPGFLARSPKTRQLAKPLAEYGRQSAGFVAGGRAYILINAFCEPSSHDWTRQPVLVMDGGNCFFHVTYEPASGAFTDLRVNGEA